MKVKPFISVAVLLAVLASTAVPVCAKQAYNAEEVEAGSRIAAENDISLESDAAALALNALCNANYGTLPEIECNANDTISSINGMIYDQSIDNKKDATAALRQIAALLGVKDFNRELVFVDCQESEYNNIYTFQQFYRGVQVESGFVSLVVAKDTKQATYLHSTFAEDLSLDVNPAISSDMARTLIRKYCNAGAIAAPELVIRQTNEGINLLTWTAQTGNPEAEGAYIDAQTGDLVETISAQNLKYSFVKTNPNRITGLKEFSINCETGKRYRYRLHDTVRNIWVMNDGAETGDNLETYWKKMGESYLRQYPLSFEQSQEGREWLDSYTVEANSLGSSENEVAVGTMYQVEKAYDFYNSNFSWKGTDNQGTALIVNAGCRFGSQASPYGNYIAFNVPQNAYVSQIFDASALDCVVHEYTHRVTGSKVRWNFSRQYGEAGCLNEGYSDIMGEYGEAEAKGTSPDWLIGAALGTPIRNAKLSPASGKSGDHYYKYTNWNEMYHVECHAGSTILSHAAYLMSRYGVPDKCAKKIWYTSMDYLPKGSDAATFEKCRAAVLIAANQVINSMYSDATLRKKYNAYIMMAFNAVNLKERYRKMGDVNNDGKIDSTDMTKISLFVSGRATLDAKSMAIADVNYDGRVTMSDMETISRAIMNGTQNAL